MSAPEYIVKQKWQQKHYLMAVFGSLLGVIILMALGYYLGNRHSILLIEENDNLQAMSQSQLEEIDTLENELVMLKQINQVEQTTNAEAGQSMQSQIQTIRDLERELSFYRSILAPQESAKGLQVSSFQWLPSDDNKVRWQVSLLQAGSTGRMLSGLATIDLIFQDNGQEVREPVLNSSAKREFGFKFRYFQNITGELELAAQRQPIAFEVQAKQYGQGQQPVTQRFPWNPSQESITDVE